MTVDLVTNLLPSPSTRTLRQFGLLGLGFFGLAAGRQWHAHGPTVAAETLGALAVALGVVGLLKPCWLRPVFVAWTLAVTPIGWLLSQVLLGLLYYGLLTPLGLVFRLLGRDALGLRRRPGQASYWTAKPSPTDASRYLRQF
jgi:hypothetical protein